MICYKVYRIANISQQKKMERKNRKKKHRKKDKRKVKDMKYLTQILKHSFILSSLIKR